MYGAERAQLSAESAERGSFKLRLHLQDPNLFSRIASTYRDLIEATYDSERLTEVLDKAAPGVKFAYEDFLKTLDFNEVEVLAQWHEGAAYVDYETAQETRPAVRGLIEQASPVLKETASLRGLLVGYTRKAPRFEFYNLDTSEIIRGTITRELQRNLPFDQEIVLGRSRVYSVRVEITRRGEEPPKYKLLAFTPLESR
jgi:DNA repair exonuclease SbcCD nuclease subunit